MSFHFLYRKCFKEMLGENVEALDFGAEPEQSRDYINQFVERITKNNIRNLLPVGSIKTDTNAILANAASFKGDWATKFDKENTKKKIFYEHGRLPVYVEMMKQKGNFNYGTEKSYTLKLNLFFLIKIFFLSSNRLF